MASSSTNNYNDNDNDNNNQEVTDEWLLQFFADREKVQNGPTTTQEQIYSYIDGSVYMGHMRQITPEEEHAGEEPLSHKRHGPGTLRTPAFVYGMSQQKYTSDEAAENARFAKWFEYVGTWKNDKLHGYGVHVQKSGDGSEIIVFEGLWENGKPMRSIHAKDEDGVYDFDESVFGW